MEIQMTHKTKSLDNVVDEAIEKVALEDMPLESLRDYRLYNEEARRLNKKAKMHDKRLKECPYPPKPCPIELHPKQRVAVQDVKQPNNPIKVFLSNELIHFDQLLQPGKEYDLPHCVVNHLCECATPNWGYVNLADGTRETRLVNKTPRFSVRTIFG